MGASQDDSTQPGLQAGQSFGRYTILGPLGAGAMGAVYEVMHKDLVKRLALKVLHPSLAQDPSARARFLQEGVAASRIRHPHVVDVSDVGVIGASPYLVMELLDGESFAARIEREGPLPVEVVAELMLPVLAAVSAAHEESVLHRDLKPDNLFLARTRDGMIVPKVLDFGISKLQGAPRPKALTATDSLIGTPCYMSPEQAQGLRHLDAASDQYSLGVILYECATARLPFEDETLLALLNAIVSGPFVPPSAHVEGIPSGFEAVVLRAMAREPSARFASVRAMGAALLPFADATAQARWAPVFGESFAPSRVASAPVVRASTPASLAMAVSVSDTLRDAVVTPVVAPPARRARALWLAALALLVVAGIALARRSPPATLARAPSLRVAPVAAAPVVATPVVAAPVVAAPVVAAPVVAAPVVAAPVVMAPVVAAPVVAAPATHRRRPPPALRRGANGSPVLD